MNENGKPIHRSMEATAKRAQLALVKALINFLGLWWNFSFPRSYWLGRALFQLSSIKWFCCSVWTVDRWKIVLGSQISKVDRYRRLHSNSVVGKTDPISGTVGKCDELNPEKNTTTWFRFCSFSSADLAETWLLATWFFWPSQHKTYEQCEPRIKNGIYSLWRHTTWVN